MLEESSGNPYPLPRFRLQYLKCVPGSPDFTVCVLPFIQKMSTHRYIRCFHNAYCKKCGFVFAVSLLSDLM